MPEILNIHKNILIIGQVQGVGFRYACLTIANSIGVKGFIQNHYDGSVYIEAEGTEEQLKQFIVWCHKGPRYASVEEIAISDDNVKGFSHFNILH